MLRALERLFEGIGLGGLAAPVLAFLRTTKNHITLLGLACGLDKGPRSNSKGSGSNILPDPILAKLLITNEAHEKQPDVQRLITMAKPY